MFVQLILCDLVRSTRECEANGLAYSRCLANTNDLATPLNGTQSNSPLCDKPAAVADPSIVFTRR